MKNAPEIVHLPIDRVKPYPRHARRHNRKQDQKLQALLRRYGQVTPIIVDETYVIVDGHAVHAALSALGHEEIMAVVTHGRDLTEVRALRLALNRIREDSRWDDKRLRAEFADLLHLGFDMQLTAFDDVEIDMALAIDEPSSGAVEEAIAEKLKPSGQQPLIEVGSVWQLGRHTIACGDARDHDLVRLANYRQVGAVFTAHPLVAREVSSEGFPGFLNDALKSLTPILADNAVLFFWMNWRRVRELRDASASLTLECRGVDTPSQVRTERPV